MWNSGIVRRMDDLGRVQIPKEFRRLLGIDINSETFIELNFDSRRKCVCLRKYQTSDLEEGVQYDGSIRD